MSNLSGKLGLITGLYIAAAMESNVFLVDDEKPIAINPKRNKINPELKDQDFTGQGLKKFIYPNGKFVWALNQKNANKKAKKLGYFE